MVGATLVVADPQGGWVLYVLFAIYGFVAYPLYGIAVAHANDSAREGDFAKISGGMLLIMGVGLAIGPAIAPLLMNNFKPVGMFIVTAAFHGALAISTLLRLQLRPMRRLRRSRFRRSGRTRGRRRKPWRSIRAPTRTCNSCCSAAGSAPGAPAAWGDLNMAVNFKAAERFPDRSFVPLGIAVIAVFRHAHA